MCKDLLKELSTSLSGMEKADHIERLLAAILSSDARGNSRMMAEYQGALVRAVKAVPRAHRGRACASIAGA